MVPHDNYVHRKILENSTLKRQLKLTIHLHPCDPNITIFFLFPDKTLAAQIIPVTLWQLIHVRRGQMLLSKLTQVSTLILGPYSLLDMINQDERFEEQ